MAMGNGQWHGNGNGKLHGEAGQQRADSGVISSALDPDDPSGHHGGLLLYGGRYLGICGVVERRLLAPSLVVAWDCQGLKLGTHALPSASQCIDRGDDVNGSPNTLMGR